MSFMRKREREIIAKTALKVFRNILCLYRVGIFGREKKCQTDNDIKLYRQVISIVT
jgi:hypothetical protein